jgi:hypothetical protein
VAKESDSSHTGIIRAVLNAFLKPFSQAQRSHPQCINGHAQTRGQFLSVLNLLTFVSLIILKDDLAIVS